MGKNKQDSISPGITGMRGRSEAGARVRLGDRAPAGTNGQAIGVNGSDRGGPADYRFSRHNGVSHEDRPGYSEALRLCLFSTVFVIENGGTHFCRGNPLVDPSFLTLNRSAE